MNSPGRFRDRSQGRGFWPSQNLWRVAWFLFGVITTITVNQIFLSRVSPPSLEALAPSPVSSSDSLAERLDNLESKVEQLIDAKYSSLLKQMLAANVRASSPVLASLLSPCA